MCSRDPFRPISVQLSDMGNRTYAFIRRPLVAWWLDACAVRPKAFALRSHVNGIVGTCADRQTTPQVPRIPMSTFPRRPTAHAQTLKTSPRPLASPEVHEKHTVWRSKSTFFNENLDSSLVTSGTYVTSKRRHALDDLIHKVNVRCLLPGGRRHEQWMRPWNIMVEL